MYELDTTEKIEMNRMFEESVGNELLTEMLIWFTTFRDGPERQLLNRAQELAGRVNNFVRNPSVYPVDYAKEKMLWDKKSKSAGTARTRGAATEAVEKGEGASPSPSVQTNDRKVSATSNAKKRKVSAKVTSAQPDIPIRTVPPRIFEKPESDEDEDEDDDEENEVEIPGPSEEDLLDRKTYEGAEPANPVKRRRLLSRAVLSAIKNNDMNSKMEQLKEDDDRDFDSFKSSCANNKTTKWEEDPKRDFSGASIRGLKAATNSKGGDEDEEDGNKETDSSEDDLPYKVSSVLKLTLSSWTWH
jgi:hypothetical protein